MINLKLQEMKKYDFHCHSKYSSDGFLDPKKMVKIALKKGISGIAITDHNTIKGGLKAKKYESDEFQVVVGSEINTDRGEVLGFFLSEEIQARKFVEVTQEIRAQNGLVVIPHPFDHIRSMALYPDDDDSEFIDGIEVFNSRCIFQIYNQKAVDFASKNNLMSIAGSDAHFLNEIGKGGIITESDDLQEAVIKEDFTVFGEKSWFINLLITEMLKLRRK
jgi:predicted metal-dependent phosphoesterase TrpH